jgi:hypothetical protein
MKKRIRPLERALCLALCLVVGILSYRSTTAILSLAGHANNPTEGRIPGHRDQVDVRDNKPRPSKQRLVTRIPRVRDQERTVALDPLLARLLLLQEYAADVAVSVRIKSGLSICEQPTTPDYLQLFSASTPGSPHSPPA